MRAPLMTMAVAVALGAAKLTVAQDCTCSDGSGVCGDNGCAMTGDTNQCPTECTSSRQQGSFVGGQMTMTCVCSGCGEATGCPDDTEDPSTATPIPAPTPDTEDPSATPAPAPTDTVDDPEGNPSCTCSDGSGVCGNNGCAMTGDTDRCPDSCSSTSQSSSFSNGVLTTTCTCRNCGEATGCRDDTAAQPVAEPISHDMEHPPGTCNFVELMDALEDAMADSSPAALATLTADDRYVGCATVAQLIGELQIAASCS